MTCCYVCKKTTTTIKHHVSYLPQIIINVCYSCHNKIHSGNLKTFTPSKRMKMIFYAKKGHLEFENFKNSKHIPIKSYDKTRNDTYIWTNSRPLTEKEIFLKNEMKKSKTTLE